MISDPAYKEALLKIIPKIPATRSRNSTDSDTCCSTPEMKDCMAAIGKNTGGETTLFLIGHGVIVSVGKQLTQGLTTGLLTAALTLGTVSVSRFNVSFMDTYAVLVNNASGEVLWSNAMRLKGDGFTDEAYYAAEKWPRSILFHIPSRTGWLGNIEAKSSNSITSLPAKNGAADKMEGYEGTKIQDMQHDKEP